LKLSRKNIWGEKKEKEEGERGKGRGGREMREKEVESAKLVAGKNAGLQINLAQSAINSGCDLLQPQQ